MIHFWCISSKLLSTDAYGRSASVTSIRNKNEWISQCSRWKLNRSISVPVKTAPKHKWSAINNFLLSIKIFRLVWKKLNPQSKKTNTVEIFTLKYLRNWILMLIFTQSGKQLKFFHLLQKSPFQLEFWDKFEVFVKTM